MNYIILIIVAIVGISLGTYFARKRNGGLLAGQTKRKNKENILELLQANEKVANNDIEKLLGGVGCNPTRYMNDLEKEQKAEQARKDAHI